MKRWRAWTVIGLVTLSGLILAAGWVMDAHRIWEGPVAVVVAPGFGLHRMDVIVLALAAAPWLGILAITIWPKRPR